MAFNRKLFYCTLVLFIIMFPRTISVNVEDFFQLCEFKGYDINSH